MFRALKLSFSVLIFSLVSAAFAQTSFSDNFDSESLGLNYTAFANWDVTAGSVDVIGTGFYDLLPGNGYYVDLDGTTVTGGTMSTKFAIDPGYTYSLQFDLGGSQRGDTNIVHVSLDNYTEAFTVPSGQAFTTITRTVTVANAGSKLTFVNDGGDNFGALLDRVSIDAVPEPFTMAGVIAGLAGMALRRRNK